MEYLEASRCIKARLRVTSVALSPLVTNRFLVVTHWACSSVARDTDLAIPAVNTPIPIVALVKPDRAEAKKARVWVVALSALASTLVRALLIRCKPVGLALALSRRSSASLVADLLASVACLAISLAVAVILDLTEAWVDLSWL